MTANGHSATPAALSWGIDRVDQPHLPLSGTYDADTDASNVNIYVLDSGVRATHHEFGERVKDGPGPTNNDDCSGHGTGVAGVAAGSTWGIAKAATIYAVRVLGCDGAGPATSALAAIDWVTKSAPRPAVVNISWSIAGFDNALDRAIQASIAAGITYVIAAGNTGGDACAASPTRNLDAIVVGATDPSDNRIGFSSYGACVDLFAPGYNVATATNTSDTAFTTQNGTSFSAPMVAGAAALYLSTHPSATPAQVSDALTGCATTGVIGDPGPGSPNRLLNTRCPGSSLTIDNPGLQRSVVGSSVRLATIRTSGSDHPADLRYSATGLPDGMSIDQATGLISGTTGTAGSSTVEITVTDGTENTSASFGWDVVLGYGQIKTGPWCLDNNSGVLTDGNPIQLYDCGHKWIAWSDGRIEWAGGIGHCVSVSDRTSAAGVPIVLSTCTGAETQIWAATASGELRNPATGKCFSVPPGFTRQTPVVLADCDGSAGQQWTLPTRISDVLSVRNPGSRSTLKGSQVSLRVSTTLDDTTQRISFSATGLPTGLSIDPVSGLITGTATEAATSAVTVTAVATSGTSATAAFQWQVTDAPTAK